MIREAVLLFFAVCAGAGVADALSEWKYRRKRDKINRIVSAIMVRKMPVPKKYRELEKICRKNEKMKIKDAMWRELEKEDEKVLDAIIKIYLND